jgi:hypothetical protein
MAVARPKATYTRIRFTLPVGNTSTSIKAKLAPLKASALAFTKTKTGINVFVKIKDPTDSYPVLIGRVVAIYPMAALSIKVDVSPDHDWAG